MSITLPPLPVPAGTLVPPAMTAGSSWYSHGYTADQMHAHAAAVSAAKDAEIERLRERVRVLEDALRAMLTHMGMDEDEWNKPTFDQARAALEQKP